MNSLDYCVVVCTQKNRFEYLENFLDSLKKNDIKCNLAIIVNDCTSRIDIPSHIEKNYCVVTNDKLRFELGAIKRVYDDKIFLNDFLFFHDSIEIKSQDLLKLSFDSHKNRTVYFFWRFMSYCGKFRKDILNTLNIPVISKKSESVWQEELFFKDYLQKVKEVEQQDALWLFPGFSDTNIFEEKFGRKNMILENNYIKKYKGTWNISMIKEE